MDDIGVVAPVRQAVFLLRYQTVKRIFDRAFAASLLAILSPLLLGVALLVRLTSPGPSLFRQTRVGLNGREFQMLKFRTMFNNANDQVHRKMNICELQGDRTPPGTNGGIFRLENDLRITRIGHWLRRYGIDELPQLINVLRGEMSIIGPRPSLPWEVELFTPEQCQRHTCLPGITGLWQVSNRYSLSMPEMLVLDVQYAQTRSLKLDLWILLQTPKAILFDWNIG